MLLVENRIALTLVSHQEGFYIKKKINRQEKNGVGHPKAFKVPTKKNTGMDENIPVLPKDRAKTILYPYYITYMKALLSILKSTAT